MLRTKNLATEIFHRETTLVESNGKLIEKLEYHFVGIEKELVKDLQIFTYDKKGNPIYCFDF